MPPLVSVLIPAYNAAPWIGETLASVCAQTYAPTEIIVVDDGSTDETAAIVAREPRATLVRQTNRGPSAAMNRAFAASRGDFIEFLDADDLLAPDKIARQVALLDGLDGEYVAAAEWARFYGLPDEATFEPQALWADFDPVTWLVTEWNEHLMMHGAAWLIPRRIVERAGGWNEELTLINDLEFFSRVLLASRGIKFCHGARTYYRSGNPASVSGMKSRRAWESALLSLQLGTRSLLGSERSARTLSACARVFQRYAYEVYPQQPDLAAAAEREATALGGSPEGPSGGPVFKGLSSLIGWRNASRIRERVYQSGYRRAAVGWRISRQLKAWQRHG
jgi:glycosyltransferase involved in cell wall biosynthesis